MSCQLELNPILALRSCPLLIPVILLITIDYTQTLQANDYDILNCKQLRRLFCFTVIVNSIIFASITLIECFTERYKTRSGITVTGQRRRGICCRKSLWNIVRAGINQIVLSSGRSNIYR